MQSSATASLCAVLVLALGVALGAESAAAQPSAAANLLVNHQSTPVVNADDLVRFSWSLAHSERAQGQSAYRIVVSLSPALSAPVWDSGKVTSPQSTLVRYPNSGPTNPLAEDTTFWWAVTWWDLKGTPAPQSAATSFDSALISSNSTSAWDGAEWIASAANNQNLFRKQFSLDTASGAITRARAYVVGLGWHALSVNGQDAMSGIVLAPGWTQYARRILYLSYDITALLQSTLSAGAATVGLELGEGYRNKQTFPNLDGDSPPTDSHPCVARVLLRIQYADGTVDSVVSDASWSAGVGPITMSHVYNGVSYDARMEQAGWNANNFAPPTSGGWSPVTLATAPGGVQSVQSMPPVTVQQFIAPQILTAPQAGMYVVDFGRNFAGVVQLTLGTTCPAGSTVVMAHAEILNDDGSGMIYVDNLRTAKATDSYTCKGDGTSEVFVPRFTYHGFRYVQVTGFPAAFDPMTAMMGLHFHTANGNAGHLSFDSPLSDSILTAEYNALVAGQRSNMMSVPTDCDQRDERLGWMGDASLSSDSFLYSFDSAAFFVNYLTLIRDDQNTDGTIPDVVPFMRYGGRPADPSWSAAYPQLVYSLYKYTGDLDLVASHYPNLKQYLNYVTSRVAASGMAAFYASYGDWVPPPPAPKCSNSYLSATSYLRNIQQIGVMALALGLTSDFDEMQQLFATQMSAFNAAFFNAGNYQYDIGVQTDYTFALQLGAQAGNAFNTQQIAYRLLNDIVGNNTAHITTGISGFKSLMSSTLGSRNSGGLGRVDLLHQMLTATDYPSIGYMLYNPLEPATTIWELMDAPSEGPGMNSRNHHMFSSVSQAFYEQLGGLSQPSIDAAFSTGSTVNLTTVGWAHVRMAPPNIPGLSTATASYINARGNFQLGWQRHGGIQCAKAAEDATLAIDCGALGGTIQSIEFASFGTPAGACGGFGYSPCHASSSAQVVQSACVGQQTCTITPTDALFGGDPCFDTKKWLTVQARCSKGTSTFTAAVTIPTGSTGTLEVPLLYANDAELSEGDSVVYGGGEYRPGVAGITDVVHSIATNTLDVSLGSGQYSFVLQSAGPSYACGNAPENGAVTLTCPNAGQVITAVTFASFGLPTATEMCTATTPGVYGINPSCNGGTGVASVEAYCIGLNNCTIPVSDDNFGDPCFDTVKAFTAEVICANN